MSVTSDHFSFAHLSDIHLAPLPEPSILELCSKRILGYLSWKHKRYRYHTRQALDLISEKLKELRPDHCVISGDLTNLSLKAEYRNALNWLRGFGSPDDTTIIPGNHDAYVPFVWRNGFSLWKDYMSGDDGSAAFPFVRIRGPLAFIGLSSSVPTMPGFATGRVSTLQLAALAPLLSSLKKRNLVRVLLVHHPVLGSRIGKRRCLTNEEQLRSVLKEEGAELVLSGHQHELLTDRIEGPKNTTIATVCAPSASNLLTEGAKVGGFIVFDVSNGCNIRGTCWYFDQGTKRLQFDAVCKPLAQIGLQ